MFVVYFRSNNDVQSLLVLAVNVINFWTVARFNGNINKISQIDSPIAESESNKSNKRSNEDDSREIAPKDVWV